MTDPNAVLLGDGRVLVIEGNQPWDQETGAWEPPSAEVWDPATGGWGTTESLNSPRTAFVAVPLADGRALVTGGLNDIGQSYSSTYVYDPRSGHETWMKVGLMGTARTAPSAAVLPDGRVLVAGGYFHVEPSSSRDAAHDVVLATYRLAAPGETELSGPPLADILPDYVGAALGTAELFDPATGTWSATGPLNYARHGAPSVTLADGRVLVVGSSGGETQTGVTVDSAAFDSAEIYDPETGRFSLAGTLPDIDRSALVALGVSLPDGNPQPGESGTLVALKDGGALLVGHVGWWKHQGEISRSFRFDPQTEGWHEVGKTFAVRREGPDVTAATPGVPRSNAFVAALSDGRVLVAGDDGSVQYAAPTNRAAELYDPATDTWSPLPPMLEARAGGAAVVLTDGSVLLVGGYARQAPCGGPSDPPCGAPGTLQVNLASAVRFVPSQ